jgi:hypothetical protein
MKTLKEYVEIVEAALDPSLAAVGVTDKEFI